MKFVLKMLAPYLAVGVFWVVTSNAWLAILAYHVQILLWQRGKLGRLEWPDNKRVMLIALPAILAGPVMFFLLPSITQVELTTWLSQYGLSRWSLLLMIPYFGLVHPYLEQIHWQGLRDQAPIAHAVFAGYHVIVLSSLLSMPWLIASFIFLLGLSLSWQLMERGTDGLAVSIVSHTLADLGVILAAWFVVS